MAGPLNGNAHYATPETLPLLSPLDRQDLVHSLISSQAIEGIKISEAEAEQILDQVLRKPRPDIG